MVKRAWEELFALAQGPFAFSPPRSQPRNHAIHGGLEDGVMLRVALREERGHKGGHPLVGVWSWIPSEYLS